MALYRKQDEMCSRVIFPPDPQYAHTLLIWESMSDIIAVNANPAKV